MTDPHKQTPQPPEDDEPAVSFKLLVTVVLVVMFVIAGTIFYSGATGIGQFRKACDGAKGKLASGVIAELTAIGATEGAASENGTITVEHKDGAKCVVRVTDDKVFSSLFEE